MHDERSLNSYYDREHVEREVAAGRHREVIGGMWDELGRLQLEFLVTQGLKPEHRVLDVGCGSLRAGVHLVDYLDPGNYFGIDIRSELLDAGYEREIVPAGLAPKLPRGNLVETAEFDARFAMPIDYALAQSVFTHLPLNYLKLALARLAGVVQPGGRLYVTFFEVPPDEPFEAAYRHSAGGVVTFPVHDPFHYRVSDILNSASGTPWRSGVIGEWGHPRDQKMAVFVR